MHNQSPSSDRSSTENAPRRRRVYILPNLFTTANMLCGFYAVIAAFNGNFVNSAWAIMIAILFDSMDGRVARLTRATSSFGVQYDSLSDLTSFGVAPALVGYLWCLQPFGRLGWLAAFLFVVCAALRLARFNISTDTVPKNYFQGLPSPVAAATVATGILFYHDLSFDFYRPPFLLTLMLVQASLMISSIRFLSFKEFRINRYNSFGVLAVVILTIILIAVRPEVTLFGMCLLYTCVNVGLHVYQEFFSKKHPQVSAATKEAPHK